MSLQKRICTAVVAMIITLIVLTTTGCENDIKSVSRPTSHSGKGTRRSVMPPGCSFGSEPYIHPLIVWELLGEICDRPGVVSAINLDLAETSDRFHGPISTAEFGGKVWITTETSDGLRFSYTHLGQAKSGTHVLMTTEGAGGSGIFGTVILVTTEDRITHEWNGTEFVTKSHRMLSFVGSIPLGDRFDGDVSLRNGLLRGGQTIEVLVP